MSDLQSIGPGFENRSGQPFSIILQLFGVVFRQVAPAPSAAISVIANFANINSNEYFCPVGYLQWVHCVNRGINISLYSIMIVIANNNNNHYH